MVKVFHKTFVRGLVCGICSARSAKRASRPARRRAEVTRVASVELARFQLAHLVERSPDSRRTSELL
jgi:hypothetical protein